MLHPLQQCNVLSFFGLHALISKQNFVPGIAVCSNHNWLNFGGGDSQDCGAVGVYHNFPLGSILKFLPPHTRDCLSLQDHTWVSPTYTILLVIATSDGDLKPWECLMRADIIVLRDRPISCQGKLVSWTFQQWYGIGGWDLLSLLLTTIILMNAISQVKLASCKHLITQSDFWGLIIFFIQFRLAMFC
jgi:hypothetical protein